MLRARPPKLHLEPSGKTANRYRRRHLIAKRGSCWGSWEGDCNPLLGKLRGLQQGKGAGGLVLYSACVRGDIIHLMPRSFAASTLSDAGTSRVSLSTLRLLCEQGGGGGQTASLSLLGKLAAFRLLVGRVDPGNGSLQKPRDVMQFLDLNGGLH